MKERLAIRHDTACRIGGAVEVAASLLICGFTATSFASVDLPLPIKALMIGPTSVFAMALIADGIVDIAKGTHHQLLLLAWKRLTKSEVQKQRIDADIKWMQETRSEPFRF